MDRVFSASCNDAEPVTVRVTVQDEAGAPLEDVPIAIHSPSDNQFAFTDALGQITSLLDVSEGDDEINVYLYRGTRFELSVNDRVLAAEKYKEFTESYYFENLYTSPVVDGKTIYDFSIVAREAIEVTGRINNQLEFPTKVVAEVRGGAWIDMFDVGQQIQIHGVQKGVPAELFFTVEYAIYSVKLNAAQTQSNFDLGDVLLPLDATTGDAVVDITVQNAQDQWGPGGIYPLWGAVTLIRFDGELILCYLIQKADGKAVAEMQTVEPKVPPSIPPGTYYAAPGIFGEGIQMKLLDALRAGSTADLDSHNVPKIVATSGNTTSLTFDAVQAKDNIIAATGGGN